MMKNRYPAVRLLQLLPLLCGLLYTVAISRADAIHVLVWDERQPQQAQAYDNFLGNEIATRLEATTQGFELRSVALGDPQQGLSDDNLDWADVIVW